MNGSSLLAPLTSSPLLRLASVPASSRRQGIWWMLTIPQLGFVPHLPGNCQYICGQLEIGEETNYVHWQVVCAFKSKQSINGVKRVFGESIHAELTRTEAALGYVWKEETAVPDTRFEFGAKPIRRNSTTDWEHV